VGFIFLLFAAGIPPVSADDDAALDKAVKQERLEKARRFVESIEIREAGGNGSSSVVPVRTEPVLFFTDQPRNNPFGSVWIWGQSGRPSAIIEVYTSAGSDYANVIHSLSAGPLTGASSHGWTWAPDAPGISLRSLTGAPQPAERDAGRLTQLRALAREFGVVQREYFDQAGARSELRLLSNPIHRYRDPDRGILEGALFAFVHGETNPEAILLVEALAGADAAAWQFDFVRLGHAEMWARRGGEEVWHVERLDGLNPNSQAYFHVDPHLVGVQR
jgi:hypothetical protein